MVVLPESLLIDPKFAMPLGPKTAKELYDAFYDAKEDINIGVILLTGEGPSPKDGVYSFSKGWRSKCQI